MEICASLRIVSVVDNLNCKKRTMINQCLQELGCSNISVSKSGSSIVAEWGPLVCEDEAKNAAARSGLATVKE